MIKKTIISFERKYLMTSIPLDTLKCTNVIMCVVDLDHWLGLIFVIRQLTTLNCFCIAVGIPGVKNKS